MDTADCSTVEDIEQAEARRRRVFRWMLRGAVFFVVLLVAIRLLWGWEAERRLQAEIDRCHAAGEPILVSDFPDPAPIADEDNAAYWYQQALAAMKPTDNKVLDWQYTLSFSRGLIKDYPREFMKSIQPNQPALGMIRKGRGCSQVDWGYRYQSPLWRTFVTRIRSLSQLTVTAARAYYYEGDQAEAIELLLDAEALARAVGQDNGMVYYLIVLAGMGNVTAGVEDFVPSLIVENAEHTEAAANHPATRRQVKDLIQLLLDDEPCTRCWRKLIYDERALAIDTAQLCIDGRIGLPPSNTNGSLSTGDSLTGRLAQPAISLEAVHTIRSDREFLSAGSAPDYAAARRIVGDAENAPYLPRAVLLAQPLHSVEWLPPLHRVLVLHFRMIAIRRMAATALAIRLYELDHERRPASLEELVPNYLSAVPNDPFASGGRKLGYLPDAAKPRLYSLNTDSQDDGGEYVLNGRGRVDWWQKDLVFFLAGDYPLGEPDYRRNDTPSPKAQNNKDEEEDGGGDSAEGEDEEDEPEGDEPDDDE